MKKRLIDIDPLTGVKTWHSYDHLTKVTTIQTESPRVDANLNANKALYNDESLRTAGIKEGWWHVASIPLPVIHSWMAEGINVFRKEDRKKVLRRLQDPAWRYLRTGRGRLV